VTVNYDLSLPTLERGESKSLRKKRNRKKDRFAQDHHFADLPQEQLDKEIEFEQNVDLDKTMWLVLRNKRSCNNILKKFETRDQSHSVQVNDIIKFGRVNFKVSVIKSSKLAASIQGGYYLLDEKNREIKENLEKMYAVQTEL
jgi:hypothetical protein